LGLVLALGLSFVAVFKAAFAGAIQAEEMRAVPDLLVTPLTDTTLFFCFWLVFSFNAPAPGIG